MARLTTRAAIFYLMVASSIVTLVTGIILYLWPHGQRSGQLLFLEANKLAWSEWHTYVSLFALAVIIIHLIINRKLIKLYSKWVAEGRST